MKKAVILAGGKGTRLSPLTDDTPKPLMPFLGKTIIERILDRLKDIGTQEVAISTMHMADMITEKIGYDYNGMTVKYLKETTPLGTAGSIKDSKKLLALENDEPFIVISGDCVCDFDLKKAEEHHKNSGCSATIVTVECEDPLEYGIVLSDKGGLITGFNEKPCWAQVNCNRINTGIYVLNASVLDRIPYTEYDFAKDLFPAMLNNGMKLSEYTADGYWCDIGTPESYYKCCIDALEGKIASFCEPPMNSVFISDGIEADISSIGPNVSIEKGLTLGKNCSIAGTVIHENVSVGENCRIEGAIICNNAKIGNNCHIEGGTVIGSGVTVSDGSRIGSGTVMTACNKKSAYRYDDSQLFTDSNGIELKGSGMCKHLGECISEAMGKGSRIGVMYDNEGFTRAYALSMFSGLEKGKPKVLDFGEGFYSLARFASIEYKTDCFIFITEKDSKVYARLFNKNGLSPSHDFERRLKKVYKDNNRQKEINENNYIEKCSAYALYSCRIEDSLKSHSKEKGFSGTKVAFCKNDRLNNEIEILEKAFSSLGGEVTDIKTAQEESCFVVSLCGEEDICVSQSNYTFDKYHMAAALLMKEKSEGQRVFALPYLTPESIIDSLYDSVLYRYPYESSYRFTLPKEALNGSRLLSDGILLTAEFISYVLSEKINLSELASKIPKFSYRQKTVIVPDGIQKTAIIKKLTSGEECACSGDCYEGITVRYPNGKVTVVPGRTSQFRIYSEALNAEIADELCSITQKKMFEE